MEPLDALLAALGSCFVILSGENVEVPWDLYTAMLGVDAMADAIKDRPVVLSSSCKEEKIRTLLLKRTGGNGAVDSPAVSVYASLVEKSVLPLKEDDLSVEESLCSEGNT
jgi:hypothetical protein